MTDDDTRWHGCCALTVGTYDENVGLGAQVVTRHVSVLDKPAVAALSNVLQDAAGTSDRHPSSAAW
ncbi:MAG: hypothetical protein ACRDQ4_13260 [Pseudonocardiaceae bacterium]